jgi:hypothetical protein
MIDIASGEVARTTAPGAAKVKQIARFKFQKSVIRRVRWRRGRITRTVPGSAPSLSSTRGVSGRGFRRAACAPEGEQVQAADLTACPARCSCIDDLDAKGIADYLKKSYGN